MIYEAKCKKCGETFNPQPTGTRQTSRGLEPYFAPAELEHGMNEAQTEVCGGEGELTGSWE